MSVRSLGKDYAKKIWHHQLGTSGFDLRDYRRDGNRNSVRTFDAFNDGEVKDDTKASWQSISNEYLASVMNHSAR
jgi:hypothetical protein